MIGKLARNLMDDETIMSAITVNVSDLFRLKSLQGVHLLDKMVKDGYWPTESEVSIQDYHRPPANPDEALKRLSNTMGASQRMLHAAAAKTFNIKEVIHSFSRDESGLDILLTIYCDAELRPHMKLSRSMRARILDHDMGL